MLYSACSSTPLRLDAPEEEPWGMDEIEAFHKWHMDKISSSMLESDDDSSDEETLINDQHFSFDDPSPVTCGPVIQVIYIAISKTQQSAISADARDNIFGEITINDYKRNTFYMFQRKKHEAQPINPAGWTNLYLTRCPIAPVMGGNITFDLSSTGGNHVFNRKYDMNGATLDSLEGAFVLEQDDSSGFRFKIVFNRIPFAIMAKVEMFLRAPHISGEEFFHIQGKITADKVICFEIARNEEGEKMEYGKYNELRLLRYVVAVPVVSPLHLDVELYSGRLQIANESLEVITGHDTLVRKPSVSVYDCEADGFRFRLEANWMCHEDYFDYDPQIMASPIHPPLRKVRGLVVSNALVEVFTVVLGVSNSSTVHPDLYGKIVVLDGGEEFYIFDSNKYGPDRLLSARNEDGEFRTLPLAWPDHRWVRAKYFSMVLRLKDVKDTVVCGGNISWFPRVDSRYDCRLCDVIHCENGYFAAVHYSVFPDSKKAEVSVLCSNVPCTIYGSIFAEYDNYDYTCAYDKQCYRSMLFKRSEENPIGVESFSKLSLLKTNVSAPQACKHLTVLVDLWVRPGNESSYRPFKIKADTSGVKSSETGGLLTVEVNWISTLIY